MEYLQRTTVWLLLWVMRQAQKLLEDQETGDISKLSQPEPTSLWIYKRLFFHSYNTFESKADGSAKLLLRLLHSAKISTEAAL